MWVSQAFLTTLGSQRRGAAIAETSRAWFNYKATTFVLKEAYSPASRGTKADDLCHFTLAAAVGLVATAGIEVVMAYRRRARSRNGPEIL